MRDLKHIFTPHKNPSQPTMSLVIAFQVILFFAIWLFSPFVFLPTLPDTFRAWNKLIEAGFANDLITSFTLNLQAIGISCVVSLGLAYLTVMPFFRPLVGFLSKLRFLSMVGLPFFFTLIATSGHVLKLYLLVFSVSVFFVTSMMDVLNAVPKTQYDLARTLRMGNWGIVWEVVIIGQLDKVFDVLRQNAAIGWMMLTLVEGMSRSDGGIGTILLTQNKHFHLDAVLAIQVTILILGLAQDYAFVLLKNLFCPYATLTTERK